MNDTQRNRGHHRVANLRADAPHKLSTTVTAEYGTVVVEDLNVAGMLRNRGPHAGSLTPDSARSAALAAAVTTGTGVAGDQGAQAPKPRGADRKTRTTRPSRKAGTGGQVAQPCRTSGRQKGETVLKPKPSRFGDVTDHPGRKARMAEIH